MTLPEITRDIAETVRAHSSYARFSGVIRVELGERVLFEEARGLANRSDSLLNKPCTRFQMASGCKLFTAVAICQLIEEGRLSFDTRLGECLPEDFPRFDTAITIRHLLTHTSGIPDYFDEASSVDYEVLWRNRPMYGFRSPADFLPLFQHEEMRFSPGTRFAYNNGAYVLLGLIVERLSGLDFPTCIAERVFHPSGMSDSGYFRLDRLPARTAHAYIEDPDDGSWRTNQYAVPILGGSDGGAYTTAADLGSFWRSLRSGRLLGEAMLQAMFTPSVVVENEPPATHYGLGVWLIERASASPTHFVCGCDPGVCCLSSVHRDGRLIITILCNADCGPWGLDLEIAAGIE